MKTIAFVSSILIVAALAWPQDSRAQGVPLVFNTTFDCPDWTQGMGMPLVCDPGIAQYGGWTTSNGNGDQITVAANNPAGAGGKGFRHYRGDGKNNNGGGLRVTLPSTVTEVWVRFYMRYSSGFQWGFSPPHPHYTKELYWNVGGPAPAMVFGYQGGAWGVYANNTNHPGSLQWYQSQGNSDVGDGQFHCYEYHAKQNGAAGVLEMWVDGVKYLNKTADLASTPWWGFGLGSNQNQVIGAGATDYYTDYDDLAVSTSGRIGCGAISGGIPAPQNLRVQ